jgi:hypothetical protein
VGYGGGRPVEVAVETVQPGVLLRRGRIGLHDRHHRVPALGRHPQGAGGRPPAFDTAQYRRRNAVERCVNKWKQFRAAASRYDKRDYIFNGTLTIAAIVIWLRDTVQEPSETP